MAVSELDAATIILNAGGIDDSATMPTISAGTNRVVPVFIDVYSGGGSCSLPDAVTCNGRAALFVVGDSPSSTNGYLSAGMWMFNEADVPFVSGQTLVSTGGSGSVKSIHVMSINDCAQTVPVNKGQARTNAGGTLTVPLTRGAPSLTIAHGWTEASASSLTFTNPARTSIITYSGRWVSSAVATDSGGTSDFTSSTVGGGYENIVAIANFLSAQTYSVTSVNGGTNSVQIGSSGNTAETTGLTAVTAASLDGVAMTSVAGSSSPWTFTCPPLTDGAVSPYPSGTFSITGAEGSPTLAGVTVTLPTGLTSVTLSGTLNTTNTGVLYNFSPAALVTDRIFYPPVPTSGKYIAVDSQGNIDTNHSGTVEFWHWKASTGVTRSYNVLLGSGGVVNSGGLTSSGLTSSGLTSSGL